MMFIKASLLPLLTLALEASAFWRLPCHGRVVAERVDPIIAPGQVAGHVHAIHGTNSFSANATNDDLMAGTCSSCQVKQDHSAYWTPAMYFNHADGSYELVPQTGGMLVYYLQRGENVKAFPPGFQMIAGDPLLRDFPYREIERSHWEDKDRTEAALRQRAVGFNCLNYAEPAESALGLRALPKDMSGCKDGIRAEVFFPSCWDGKRATAPDHKDHMRYPNLMDDGDCPPSHPVRVVSLFFETIWHVEHFHGKPGTFVFSSGDPTGYGYHGDFMNAWEPGVLQQAINECTSLTGVVEECGVFEHYKRSEQEKCQLKEVELDTDEDVMGPLSKLPGCNIVQNGPARAQAGGCNTPPVEEDPNHEFPEDMNETELYELPVATSIKSVKSSPSSSEKPKSTSEPEPTPEPEVVGGAPALLVGEHEAVEKPDPKLVVVTVTQYTTFDVKPTPAPVRRRHGHGHRHGRMH